MTPNEDRPGDRFLKQYEREARYSRRLEPKSVVTVRGASGDGEDPVARIPLIPWLPPVSGAEEVPPSSASDEAAIVDPGASGEADRSTPLCPLLNQPCIGPRCQWWDRVSNCSVRSIHILLSSEIQVRMESILRQVKHLIEEVER